MRATALIVLLAAAAVFPLKTAQAQGPSVETVVTQVVARVCEGNAGRPIRPQPLAEALVVEARVAPTLSEMAAIADEIARTGSSNRVNTTYRNAVSQLEESLARGGSREAQAITVAPAPPQRRANESHWLFDQSYILTCASASAAGAPEFARLQPIAIRGSVDALDDLGSGRRAAAAAQIGWERARVTNLDGQTTRTETLIIDATVGLALGNEDRFAILYADYSRNRAETRQGVDEASVEDVEALELGVHGTGRFGGFRTTGRVGVTLDEITGARYLRGNLLLTPIGVGNLGLCNLNSYRTIAPGIRARCTLAAELELRDVLRRGSADIGTADILGAIGGSAGFEIGPGIDVDGDVDDGIVGSVRYTYLTTFAGDLRDIERLEASLSYRWWVGDLGFDFGLTYANGTERKSFSDENRLGFRIGLIY